MTRYIIEAKTKNAESLIEELVEKTPGGKLKVVDKYDPFEKLSGEVVKMGEALRKFKMSGIDWDVFNFYLRGKGLPQTDIDAVLGNVKDFFAKVGLLEKE